MNDASDPNSVKPGVYAVAIRATKSATGQSGELLELGRVVVE